MEMSTRQKRFLYTAAFYVYSFFVFLYCTILIKYVTQLRINVQALVCGSFKPDCNYSEMKVGCVCTFPLSSMLSYWASPS